LKTGGWARVAFAMFAVGWGANQFSPILIVYRHELHLDAGTLANLFAIYAAALIPGLLAGGPLSDRFGRRRVVIPFAVLSPVATLILVFAPHSVAALESGRALAGLCSGVVFGAATAWVRELSADVAISARRSALALTAGFGTGPVVAALLAQWAPHPRVVPYLPHLAIGATAATAVLRVPETATQTAGHIRRWPPTAARKPSFWLAIAPAAPWVFGSASLAFVVLPEEVTSANSLSVSFAGLTTALTLGRVPRTVIDFNILCVVTAHDAQGQMTSASSPGVVIGPGIATLKITSAKVTKSLVTISAIGGPGPALERGPSGAAYVVLDRVLGKNHFLQLAGPKIVTSRKGKFTISAHDSRGRHTYVLLFVPPPSTSYAETSATRKLTVK
jgi:MFS family permease